MGINKDARDAGQLTIHRMTYQRLPPADVVQLYRRPWLRPLALNCFSGGGGGGKAGSDDIVLVKGKGSNVARILNKFGGLKPVFFWNEGLHRLMGVPWERWAAGYQLTAVIPLLRNTQGTHKTPNSTTEGLFSCFSSLYIPSLLIKNTKNWYTIDALGAIFAIFTILDTFAILLQ